MNIKRCVGNKILKLKQNQLEKQIKINAQLQDEIIKLKQEIEDLSLHPLCILNGSIDKKIKVSDY